MLRYCMALPLKNEPKHSYVVPAVTEIIYFFSFCPVQSSFEISLRKASWFDVRGYTERNVPPSKLEWYWTSVCWQTCFLFILHVRNVRRNIIGQFSKKKQYITPLSHPLPSLKWVAARSNMTAGSKPVTSKYSNCIRYNFFIFCPICMKFSHNFLHTYSFILGIIKHNWKIRRFWVAGPLKLIYHTSSSILGFI